MRKVGKVINIEKNKVYIITQNKEFLTVEKHTTQPTIGELYAGEEFQKFAMWKYIFAVVIIVLLIFLTRKVYLDSKHNFSAIIDMNSSLRVEVDGLNRIKKAEGRSPNGNKVLAILDLNHKPFEEALHLILDESIKQKYLTKAHAEDGFKISIFISDNDNNSKIDLTEFKKYAGTKNFKVVFNNNGQFVID